MDLKYLKSLCECYYTDHLDIQQLYSNNQNDFINDIFEEMKNIFSNCRYEDKDVDFDFNFNQDKINQQKIVYNLIEIALHDRFPNDIKLYYDDQDYSNMYDQMIISESLALPIFALVSVSLAILSSLGYQSTGFNKIKWSTIVNFNKLNDKIHNIISNMSASSRVKSAVILNNSQSCYNSCGIKDVNKDLSWRIGASFLSHSKYQSNNTDMLINFETPKGREQAFCLTNCYLNWSLDQLEPLLNSYLSCLYSVGERGTDLNDLKLNLLTVPSSSICKPYYSLLKDHRKLYCDIVEYVSKDSSEEEEFLRKYDDKINSILSKPIKHINSPTGQLKIDDKYYKIHSGDNNELNNNQNDNQNNKSNHKFNNFKFNKKG